MSAITAKASRKMKKYAVLTREPRCFLGSFDFSWEQRKVGDLLIERNQQAPMSDKYPLMAFIANEGVAPKGERYDRSALVTDTVNKLYKKTEKGDFIYSSNNLETGSIGLNKYGKACISPVYSIFEPTGIADSDFLGRRLVRKDFINAMVKWRQGVIYGQWRIHESDFLKIEITVPSVEEQRKIGAYLDQLDNLITLHQRKCVFLFGFFQAFISMIFTASTFSWEQRKLGDIADIVGGGTPSTGNQSYWDGDIDWYAPAEIADQIYANSSQKKITGLGYENSSAKMLPPGTVLFTSRAGIGKTAILTRKGCTNQGFQSIVPHRGELDSYFIFSRTEELKRYGELVGAGSTFVEVSGKQMAVMELMMPPTMREQQTIGGFFQQLDHLITLHQRKGKAAVTGCSNDANNSKGVYCKARDFGYKCCKKVESP
jgi:type I restriction enzyme S subunit